MEHQHPRVAKRRAFTLVELIVVVTILAILATIGFVMIGNLSSQARDSDRVADVANIKKSLEVYGATSDGFPLPSQPSKTVTYSGQLVFTEWVFGDSVLQAIKILSKKPTDPKFPSVEYNYSVLAGGKKYQLAAALEDGSKISLAPMPTAYAGTANATYISGNYATATGTVMLTGATVSFPLPSLTTSDARTGAVDYAGLVSGSAFISDASSTDVPFAYKLKGVSLMAMRTSGSPVSTGSGSGGSGGGSGPAPTPPVVTGPDCLINANTTWTGAQTCNTLTVTNNATLTLQWDTTTGSGVTINANTVTVDAGATIYAKGYLGTAGPCKGSNGAPGGYPGGGGGAAGKAGNGNPYNGAGAQGIGGAACAGSTSQPVTLGSGGGNGTDRGTGGYGGGAVKIAVSGTLTVNGTLSANGGLGDGSTGAGGAGGSIWIDTATLSGNGVISANGGSNGGGAGPGGWAGGRIAMYYATKNFSGTVSVIGGTGFENGSAGSIYDKNGTSGNVTLLVANSGSLAFVPSDISQVNQIAVDSTSRVTFAPGSYSFASISGGGNLVFSTGSFTFGNLVLWTNSSFGAGTQTFTSLRLTGNASIVFQGDIATGSGTTIISDSLAIDAGSTILAKGYPSATGPCKGSSGGVGGYPGGGGGGAGKWGNGNPYNGLGAQGIGAAICSGSNTQPTNFGGAGGNGTDRGTGGYGGGALKLVVSGTTTVDGTLSVSGGEGDANTGAGGAGGSLWIDTGLLAGNGTISANGGTNGGGAGPGGGGGGRIALYYTTKTYSGTPGVNAGTGFQAEDAGSLYQQVKP